MLSGDLSQSQRSSNLDRFRSGMSSVLIATDVASRGLDINDVSYVINYDFPVNVKTYIHRIGRTGRAGKQGKSIAYLDGQASAESVRELMDLHKKHKLETPKELTDFLSVAGDGHRGSQYGQRGTQYGQRGQSRSYNRESR